jgi:hypothetical protein
LRLEVRVRVKVRASKTGMDKSISQGRIELDLP